MERLKSYIKWIETKGVDGFDKDECLSYLNDALLAETRLRDYENAEVQSGMKCYENRDNFRERVHTIQVTFQSGEYKGRIAYTIGGNCFGADLLEFSAHNFDEDVIKGFVVNDCNFSWNDEYEMFSLELKNENGDTLLCGQEDENDLCRMVVALEIIDCKIVSSK